MNIIDRYILRKAEKIKLKKKIKKLEENLKQEKFWEELREVRKEASNKIEEEFDRRAEEMMLLPKHVNIGDKVILNKYNIGYYPNNGWDGGPTSYITNCGDKSPVTLRLTDIYVDFSLANDRLEKWIEDRSIDYLNLDAKTLIHDYSVYYNKKYNDIDSIGFGNLGLYLTAKFEPVSHKFAPIWGLNLASFLKLDSEEGQRTLILWKEEEFLEKKIKDIELERTELIKRIEKIRNF
jgi:hypothetical protein